MSEYIVKLPNGGAADECIRLRGYEKSLYGYELREEIVRCRDCKLFTNSSHYGAYCTNFGAPLHDDYDGFCAWGERRTDDN